MCHRCVSVYARGSARASESMFARENVGLSFSNEPKQARACERNEGVREGYTVKERKRRERERHRDTHMYICIYVHRYT